MPKRSRTHQLEDASIHSFEQLLPLEWVCRRKDKDYGVDLEVEVFDESGEATGLLFYVQLKATDDIKKERSVSMKVNRLEYLASLDNPSMVVRYCNASKAVHWIWVSNIFAKMAKPETKTFRVQFEESDRWSNVTPMEIVQTLKVFRTIRLGSQRTPIGLSVKMGTTAEGPSFELKYAVSKVRDSSRMVTTETDGSKCLPVTVSLEGNYLFAAVDVISSIGVRLRHLHRDEILAQLTYVLAYMAGRYEFSSQAKNLAQTICDQRLVCQCRDLASSLACQFVDKPCLCAEIASLNSLHGQQDFAYGMYIRSLLGSELPAEERSDAVKRFYTDALKAHLGRSSHSQSAIHYSYGNYFMMTGNHMQAVRHYNAARKKNPDYLGKDYFLAELGATLYFKKRFSVAARLYAASFDQSKLHKTALRAGDAFLFSGDFCKSSKFYDIALTSNDEFEKAEASLKIWLSDWCAEFCERNKPPELCGVLHRLSIWSNVLDEFINEEQHEHALGASLMLAFLLENDEKTWTQAISFSIKTKETRLILPTISTAIHRSGYDAYTPLRDFWASDGLKNEVLLHFDEIVDRLHKLRTSTFVEQHHFDMSVEIPAEFQD